MEFELKTEGKFSYYEEGQGEPIVLLHGLFGSLSNFSDVINYFKSDYTVLVPQLPLFDLSSLKVSLKTVTAHVTKFIGYKGFDQITLVGNSLGGHVALLYSLANPEKIKRLVLTGSSGLFEQAFGDGYPKRGDYEYIKKKTEFTFYDPKTATKELIDDVYDTINDRKKAICIIMLAKSAIRNNLKEELHKLKMPTKLIWGNQDNITPPFVAEEFNQLIENSSLSFIDKCGHAAMMEQPEQFNELLSEFLNTEM